MAVDLLMENHNFDRTKLQLRKLFVIATKQIHFSFENTIYDHVDGVAPLAPAQVHLFLNYFESSWLNNPKANKVLFCRRYVDDSFCLLEREEEDYFEFFEFINLQHPNLHFTFEKENEHVISFIKVASNSLDMTTFFKKK